MTIPVLQSAKIGKIKKATGLCRKFSSRLEGEDEETKEMK
jgi:hypothetical protein